MTTRSAPASGEQIREQARGDRFASGSLAVLTGVAVERAHRGDALGRRALGRVDHDQLLEDAVVDRLAVRLEHEHVGAAHVLVVAAVELAVREARQRHRRQRDAEALGDLLGERRVAAPGEEHQPLVGNQLHAAILARAGRSGLGVVDFLTVPRRRSSPRSSVGVSARRATHLRRSWPARPWRARPAERRGSPPRPRRCRRRRRPRRAPPARCSTRSARRPRPWSGACRVPS